MRSLIVAVGRDGLIGVNGDLPWSRIPADMEHFVDTTNEQIVIMGRKTYESIPKKYRPLKNRVNVIVTRDLEYDPGDESVIVIHDLTEEEVTDLEARFPDKRIFFIGGAEVYKKALDEKLVDQAIVTQVGNSFPPKDAAKTYFDMRHLRKHFKLLQVQDLCQEPLVCTVETYIW